MDATGNYTLDDFTWGHIMEYQGGTSLSFIDSNGVPVYLGGGFFPTGRAEIYCQKKTKNTSTIANFVSSCSFIMVALLIFGAVWYLYYTWNPTTEKEFITATGFFCGLIYIELVLFVSSADETSLILIGNKNSQELNHDIDCYEKNSSSEEGRNFLKDNFKWEYIVLLKLLSARRKENIVQINKEKMIQQKLLQQKEREMQQKKKEEQEESKLTDKDLFE